MEVRNEDREGAYRAFVHGIADEIDRESTADDPEDESDTRPVLRLDADRRVHRSVATPEQVAEAIAYAKATKS